MVLYRDTGVDQNANQQFVDRIKRLTRGLDARGVIGGLGSFAGMMDLGVLGYAEPVLVAGTDGVGSKLEIAFALDNHHTIGIDLVAMCVNDVVCHGARPLFFLDYMAVGRLDMDQGEAIIGGIVEGCRRAGCALLGGETAQLPSFYREGRYDLAGFAVGVVEKARIIDGRGIAPGDVVIGLPSSGPHSNGYGLVRRVVERQGLDLSENFEGRRTLGEVLLEPTRIYVPDVFRALDRGVAVKGIAHVTGDGIPGNLSRVLPPGVGARLRRGSWPEPRVFAAIKEWGDIPEAEMFDVFNMGLGMLLVVGRGDRDAALAAVDGSLAVGECVAGDGVEIL
jgi:phosphoribosylformylglycinamidine cyclo-ligase